MKLPEIMGKSLTDRRKIDDKAAMWYTHAGWGPNEKDLDYLIEIGIFRPSPGWIEALPDIVADPVQQLSADVLKFERK